MSNSLVLFNALPYSSDMEQLQRNLAFLLDREKTNPNASADRVGVSQPTLHRLLKGRTANPTAETLRQISEHFGVTIDDLMKRDLASDLPALSQGSNVVALHPEEATPSDSIQVKEYRVSFSAGNGHRATYDAIEEAEPATYRLSWFHKTGVKPKNAKRFKVVGDSMEPFLFAGDSVLIDTSENDPTRIIDGKLYAIRYGNDLRVKRLFRRLDGTLILRSDNPAYKDEEVPPELAEEHISILGRVRDKSGAGGL